MSPFEKLYDRVFKNMQTARAVLVIGCGDDTAFIERLEKWFPVARITAVDIRPVGVPGFIYMDARLPGVGRMLPEREYDVIFDDVRDLDFAIFENMAPYVTRGGVYCIQYLNEKDEPSYIKDIAAASGLTTEIYDYRPLHDDTIAIVSK